MTETSVKHGNLDNRAGDYASMAPAIAANDRRMRASRQSHSAGLSLRWSPPKADAFYDFASVPSSTLIGQCPFANDGCLLDNKVICSAVPVAG
jgi:hypothetical protein